MKHLYAALVFMTAFCFTLYPSYGQSRSREELLSDLQSKRAELHQLEKDFLSPSLEDQNTYAAFLSQSDTGLIRLLPRELYDSEVYKKNNKTLTIRGGGAYYSFTRLTHEYGYGSDLQLESGQLSVGFAGANYGMLLNLGNVSLDQVTSEDPRISFMVSYDPPSQEPKARVEARQFGGKGITVGDVEYRNRVPAVVDNTYLLRSIDYSTSDVLVAFRVVRKDSDGSVILAWKLLKKYAVPKLAQAN